MINKFLLFLMILSAAACTGVKKLPSDEKLYTGARVELISPKKLKQERAIKSEAETAIRPKPNKSFLGFRPKLSLFLIAGDTAKKGRVSKWLKKQGEPPVLMSSVKPGQTAKFIDAKLFNMGIFNGITEYKTIEKRHTVRVIYVCHVSNPYTIKLLKNEVTDTALYKLILAEQNNSLIQPGDNYSLSELKKERERIDVVLKDNGYYFFNPDYLLFKADTSQTEKTVSLRLTIKDGTPLGALVPYRINNITIDPDFTLDNQLDSIKRDTLMLEGVIFSTGKTSVRPTVILQSLYFRKNDLYSRKNHNITLNRLMTLGIYKYVRIKFTEADSSKPNSKNDHLLDMHIDLTTMPRRSLRAESNLVSKSNDFVGPQLNINYRNRNEFGGAELFSLNLGGSLETQIIGKYKDLYSYSFNPEINLLFPRFIVPFRLRKTNSYYVPKTKFSLGYNYIKRIGYFDMKSFRFVYGFKWKENAKKEHELNPFNINFTTIGKISPQFNALLESNPFIKKSYEEQFIAGGTYSFTFNEQVIPGQKNQVYLNVLTEIAGNAISAGERLAGKKPNADEPLRIGGAIYSQFAKLSVDVRNYTNFKNSKLVLRWFGGIGKPYGNSSTLPYNKQYFSGGPYSVRAFFINSLGPGTYQQRTADRSVFIQQGGDIKLETNVEYRFDIIKYLKGALFLDAGNVWLLRSDPALVTAPFTFSESYKEIAMGTGIGVRIDVRFFVLRFDLATPLRKPWLPEDERWVINKIAPGNSAWRSDNLVLNVAIGYPF